MEVTKPNEELWNQSPKPSQDNKKVLAGVMGILFGSFGVHKFILGYTNTGIIQLVLSVVTCGFFGIVGFIEGIIYLTKGDDEFYQMYQVNEKKWF